MKRPRPNQENYVEKLEQYATNLECKLQLQKETRLRKAERIIRKITNRYNTTPEAILSRTKVRRVSEARMLAMYEIYINHHYTMNQIGEIFERDYSTVIYSIKTIKNLIKNQQLLY